MVLFYPDHSLLTRIAAKNDITICTSPLSCIHSTSRSVVERLSVWNIVQLHLLCPEGYIEFNPKLKT